MKIYGPGTFAECQEIGCYLREHSSPRTRVIMVFGSEPEIYFYAGRHSAAGAYIDLYST